MYGSRLKGFTVEFFTKAKTGSYTGAATAFVSRDGVKMDSRVRATGAASKAVI